ncbi:histone deacetylase family protein [Halioxenophilus aromaticivorans]|uniref:Histone deacetylase n=1 Tax=Halioxenophilus aromaticivorans TaxID=1306992 RepID=A0AAV3U2D1_9ALTE
MLNLYYHPLYTGGIDPEARFPRDRYTLLAQRLAGVNGIQMHTPRLATREEITTVHDADYVDRFLNGELSDKEARKIGLRPWRPEIVPRTLRIMGGSLQALDDVLSHGGLAGNMAGGTHHAFYDYGSGYCIFNDIAVCAHHALQTPKVKRILILDLDVHQGDGTAAMLQSWDSCYTVSLHGGNNFPFKKQQSDLDVELPCDATDTEYLSALDELLATLNFNDYDLLLYQAGVDPLITDRLGRLAVTREGLNQRNLRVFEKAHLACLPTVIFMGGGYAEPIADTVDAFQDLFTLAAQFQAQR